jgi:phage repressor protein C with HTH and peptisase S24 domain
MFPPAFTSRISTGPSSLVMVPAESDDMAPTIQRGDVVVVDTSWDMPRQPGVYALRNKWGLVTFRRIRPSQDPDLVRLVSDNPVDNGTPVERRPEELNLVGKMVALVRAAG